MCPPLRDNGRSQRQHALVNSIIRGSRNVSRAVSAAAQPAHPSAPDLPSQGIRDHFGWPTAHVKAMMGKAFDELGNGGGSLVSQVKGQHVPQLGTTQMFHGRTVA